jgi:hypothetical protein
MDRDEIRRHIRSAATHGVTRHIMPRLSPEDRIEPAALRWLRRWRPERAAVSLPVCSCAVGRCAICN